MKIDDVLRELESVAGKRQVRLSYESLGGDSGSGGLCKVKGEYRIIIDKRATPGERVTILAQALASFPLDDLFIPEEVRELITRTAAFRRS